MGRRRRTPEAPVVLATPPLGTPWVPLWPLTPSVQGELAYAEAVGPVTASTPGEATPSTICTLPALTFDGVTDVVLDFHAHALIVPTGAGATTQVNLYDGSTDLGRLVGSVQPIAATQTLAVPGRGTRRLRPSAGVHTYSARVWSSHATGQVNAGNGGVGNPLPAFLRCLLASPLSLVTGGRGTLTYGTSLPASPADGQEHVLVDSLTAPTYQWRFRYNAGATSAYKWEYIGGVPLVAEVAAAEATTSTSLVDLATVGPQLTVPRNGDYTTLHGCYMTAAAAATGTATVKVGAAAGGAGEAAYASIAASGHYQVATRSNRLLGRTAGDVLKVQYASVLGQSISFGVRFLHLEPVRVS